MLLLISAFVIGIPVFLVVSYVIGLLPAFLFPKAPKAAPQPTFR